MHKSSTDQRSTRTNTKTSAKPWENKPQTPAELSRALEAAIQNTRTKWEHAFALVKRGDMRAAVPAMHEAAQALIRSERLSQRASKLAEDLSQSLDKVQTERDEAVQHANMLYDEAFEDGMQHTIECEMCANEARITYITEQMLNADDPEGVLDELRKTQENLYRQAREQFQERLLDIEGGDGDSEDDDPPEEEIYPNLDDDISKWD